MDRFEYFLPTRIVFGRGRIDSLRELMDDGLQRALIVTEENVAAKSGAVQAVQEQLAGREVALFTEVEENPSLESLEQGRLLARERDAHIVIGIGGGSPMDAAKGVAVLATNDGSMRAYMDGQALDCDPLPVICIPTTSGTGSEATPYAVFTDSDAETKGGFAHPKIFPRFSIVDPELTYSMPRHVTVNTGLDALTHSIEAYLSALASPMNDLFALESIRVCVDSLPMAAGGEHQAMDAMAYASMLGGAAITHASTILLHIMGYPLTVFHGVAHGLANAALLPAFLNFMRRSSTVQDRVHRIDTLFDPVGGVDAFLASLGVSTALASYGVQEDEIEMFVQKVIVKGDVKITPAPVDEAAIAGIYRSTL